VLAAHGPPRLVLLAQTRRGYGNLAQWITVARRRAPKGEYLALMSDLEGRCPNTPRSWPACPTAWRCCCRSAASRFETLFAQAMWLKTWFGDRAAWR
jgi:error-prone DNA polymerase